MANNYCQGSAFLKVPEDKIEQAKEIIQRVVSWLETDDEVCGCVTEIIDEDGVWFHNDDHLDPDHVEEIARSLVEDLEIDEPFYCSWAYTCSKPRIDEFGGGAFVIKRGYPTYWCEALNQVKQQLEDGEMIPLALQEPTLREQQEDVWADDPVWKREWWRDEVRSEATHIGYWEWVESQREQEDNEQPN